jgi:hypothetical protein
MDVEFESRKRELVRRWHREHADSEIAGVPDEDYSQITRAARRGR